MIITKYDAAIRQLDYAILAYFSEHDVLCVATLVGASLELFRALAAFKKDRGPWDELFINQNGMTHREYDAAVRSTTNYLKHADRDPEVALDFDARQVEMLMFCAVNTAPAVIFLTPRQFIYGAWFVAKNLIPAYPNLEGEFVNAASEIFPSLASLSESEQLLAGLDAISNPTDKHTSLRKIVDSRFAESYKPLMKKLFERKNGPPAQ